MPQFEVVEAKLYHVGRIVRRLRQVQATALQAAGVQLHRDLSAVFGRSWFRRAWLFDGELAAVGGVAGSLAASEGFVWLALSDAATRYPIEMVREARRQLEAIETVCPHLTTRIVQGDAASLRFARFMGFRPAAIGAPNGFTAMERRAGWDEPTEKAPWQPFVVFGLPRSRTRWLSAFLNCHHDLPIGVSDLDGLFTALAVPGAGTVETGLSAAWRAIRERFPGARFAVVRRPVAEVEKSAAACGWAFPQGYLTAEDKRLAEIAAQPGTLSLHSNDLSDETACRKLFEHCTLRPFDRNRWAALADRNIQLDMAQRAEVLEQRRQSIAAFFDEVHGRVTVQTEPFDDFYRDAQELLAAHYAEAGSFDGLALDPNVDMARALERDGNLLVVTARVPARMVGYIVFLINPSFESKGVLMGYQNIFFVDKAYRGRLGLRLHAYARARLKERGVSRIIMRSGVRARGPAQKHLFERLGAVPMGTLHSLSLES